MHSATIAVVFLVLFLFGSCSQKDESEIRAADQTTTPFKLSMVAVNSDTGAKTSPFSVSTASKVRSAVADSGTTVTITSITYTPDITSIPISSTTTATASGTLQITDSSGTVSHSFVNVATSIVPDGSSWVVTLSISVPSSVYVKITEYIDSSSGVVETSASVATAVSVSLVENNCTHTITQDPSAPNTALTLVDVVTGGCLAYSSICFKFASGASACSSGSATISSGDLISNANSGVVLLEVSGPQPTPSAVMTITLTASNTSTTAAIGHDCYACSKQHYPGTSDPNNSPTCPVGRTFCGRSLPDYGTWCCWQETVASTCLFTYPACPCALGNHVTMRPYCQ